MLPRSGGEGVRGTPRGRGGSPLWSGGLATWGSGFADAAGTATSTAAAAPGGGGGSGNGVGGSAGQRRSIPRRRNALLCNAALAAASVALVVTVASVRQLRTLVHLQRQQVLASELLPFGGVDGGHGGGAWPGAAPSSAEAAAAPVLMAPPPPVNVPGALLLASSGGNSGSSIGSDGNSTATTAASDASSPCSSMMPATEMWGDVVRWGASHKVETAQSCCAACRAAGPDDEAEEDAAALGCNVWVWCGDADLCGAQHRECWLKHMAHPSVARPAREGPGVGWTSGVVDRGGEAGGGGGSSGAPAPSAEAAAAPVGVAAELERAEAARGKDAAASSRLYHTVTTAQGPAVHWQTRVHYYHFLKQKEACEREAAAAASASGGASGGGCDMGGWTRLLHSGEEDDLMDEIPTFVADPLPESVVAHGW